MKKIIHIIKLITVLLIFTGSTAFCLEDAELKYSVKPAGKSSESFSNAAFGSAMKNIELQVPPGRNGLTPSLSVSYNSGAPNGLLGVGWGISLGSIQRSTKHGLDYNGQDFVANGKELVPRTGDWRAGYYGEKIEGSFTKYQFKGEDGWEATATNGTKYYYGSSDGINARQISGTDVFKWCLNKIKDINGNEIRIDYVVFQDQVYPDKIYYSNLSSGAYVNRIEFTYEQRPDTIISYTSHYKVITSYRLAIINTYANNVSAAKYEFIYKTSTVTGNSLLQNVIRYNKDTDTEQTAPVAKTDITWQEDAPAWASSEISHIYGEAYWDSSAKYPLFACDRNGDGKSEIGRANDSQVAFMCYSENDGWQRNNGIVSLPINFIPPANADQDWNQYVNSQSHLPVFTGDFDGNGTMDVGRIKYDGVEIYNEFGNNIGSDTLLPIGANSYLSAYRYPVITGDFNGDGKTDLGRVTNSGISFYLSNGTSNGWTPGGQINGLGYHETTSSSAVSHPMVVGDFNGDGRTDVGRVTNTGITLYFADSTLSWTQSCSLNAFGKNSYGSTISYPMVIGDINGDGLTDIGRVTGSGVSFYLSDGKGGWDNTPPSIPTLPDLGYSAYPNMEDTPLITGDFNGDGRLDVGRVTSGGVKIYVFKNNTWTRITNATVAINDLGKGQTSIGTDNWPHAYETTEKHPIEIADFNGDGMTDIGRVGNGGMKFYLSTFKKPDLLASVENAFNHSKITYDYGIYSELKTSKLPSVMTVLDSVTLDDGVPLFGDSSHKTSKTSYRYLDGDYNRSDREFRGFKVVEVINPDGTMVQTINHTGEYLYGRPEKIKIFDKPIGGTVIAATDYVWETEDLDPNNEDSSVFVKLKSIAEMKNGITKTEFEYDSYLTTGVPGFPKTKTISGTAIIDKQIHTWTYNYEVFRRYDEDNTAIPWVWKIKDETLTGILNNKTSNSDIVRKTIYQYYGTGGICKAGNLESVTMVNGDGDNTVKTMTYDDYGNLETVTDGKGYVTETFYDPDSLSYPQSIDYPDTLNTNLNRTFTHFHQDAYKDYDYRFGLPTLTQDENKNPNRHVYDTFGRDTLTTYADAGTLTTQYVDNACPSYVVRTKGNSLNQSELFGYEKEFFDGFGKTLQTVTKGTKTNEYLITLHSYDTMGRPAYTVGPYAVTTSTTPNFQTELYSQLVNGTFVTQNSPYLWTRNVYDELGRVITVEQPGEVKDGQPDVITTKWQYDIYTYQDLNSIGDSSGNLIISDPLNSNVANRSAGFGTVITDPDGNRKTEIRDGLGRLIRVIEHGSDEDDFPYDHTTNYTFNAAGDLISVDRINPETGGIMTNSITYNSLGQKTTMNDPDMGLWKYTYDLNGNLEETIFYKNVIGIDDDIEWETNTYDELNRILKTVRTHDSSSAQFTTDNPDTEYIYDVGDKGLGKLYIQKQGSIQDAFHAYDSMGRVSNMTRTVSGMAANTRYTYDKGGNLKTMTYPDDYGVTYNYHPGTSQIINVTHGSEASLVTFSDYSPTGKIKSAVYRNAVSTTYSYKPATDRLESIVTRSGVNPLMDFTYTYKPSGDVNSLEDKINHYRRTYTYDKSHRLIMEVEAATDLIPISNKHNEDIEYSYGEKNTHAVQALTFNGLGSSDLVYDDKGNMTSGPDITSGSILARTIRYNADNMPMAVSVDNVEKATFTYGPDGKRATKTEGGVTTRYFGDHYELQGNLKVRYIFAGNQRIAKVFGENSSLTTVFYHKDHLGSTTLMTNHSGAVCDENGAVSTVYDEFGNVVKAYTSYLPYGLDRDLVQNDGDKFAFTDQEKDKGTGLYNYDARLYDPMVGLFVSADSVVPDWTDPMSLNRYMYCRGNPVIYTDPTGHDAITETQKTFESHNEFFWNATKEAYNDGKYLLMLGHAFASGVSGAISFCLPADQDQEFIFVMTFGSGALIENTGSRITSSVGSKFSGLSSKLSSMIEEFASKSGMDPSKIRFTQKSVGNMIGTPNGERPLRKLVKDLVGGRVSADDLPPIRVFEKNGKTFTLDNRRLKAFQVAGKPINTVKATAEEIENEAWKMTTKTDGLTIKVRGGGL